MPQTRVECNCQPDEYGDIVHDHGDYVCAVDDCPNLCTKQSYLCAKHEEEEEKIERLYWGEMQRRIDVVRGK